MVEEGNVLSQKKCLSEWVERQEMELETEVTGLQAKIETYVAGMRAPMAVWSWWKVLPVFLLMCCLLIMYTAYSGVANRHDCRDGGNWKENVGRSNDRRRHPLVLIKADTPAVLPGLGRPVGIGLGPSNSTLASTCQNQAVVPPPSPISLRAISRGVLWK